MENQGEGNGMGPEGIVGIGEGGATVGQGGKE